MRCLVSVVCLAQIRFVDTIRLCHVLNSSFHYMAVVHRSHASGLRWLTLQIFLWLIHSNYLPLPLIGRPYVSSVPEAIHYYNNLIKMFAASDISTRSFSHIPQTFFPGLPQSFFSKTGLEMFEHLISRAGS